MERKVSAVTKAAYALSSIAFGLKTAALGVVMLFYNQVMGLPATWVSFAIGLALIVDAMASPLIGQASDTWRSAWGRRHPFMYASALPAAVAVWALLNPPLGWSSESLFVYLMGCLIAVRIFVGMFEITSVALLPEFATGYDDRTVLSTWRTMVGLVVPVALQIYVLTVVMKPFVNAGGQQMPGQLNPQSYATYGALLAAMILVSILASAVGTHREIGHMHPPMRHASLADLLRTVRTTLLERNFLALTCAGVMAGLGAGLVGGLVEYLNTYFWQLSAREISALAGGVLVGPLLAAALAPWLSRRVGKKRAAMWNYFLAVFFGILPVTLRLLGLLPPNGDPRVLMLLVADTVLVITLAVVGVILITSMMADIVEQVQVKTQQRSEGLIFSANTMLKQVVTGVGAMGTGLILSWVGFPAKAVPGQVPEVVLQNLALAYLPVTIVTNFIAIYAISHYTISRADHESNLGQTLARKQGGGEPDA